ncbi:hypothetical protein KKH27_08120, partial [bacterium]|nr:hypothetical protein [bacterium]
MRPIIILLLVLCSGAAWGAVPLQIGHQGFLTNTSGSPLDTVVSMTFRLYNSVTGGTPLWTETQPSCTVRAGTFSVLLGSVVAVPDSFSGTSRWLGTTVGNNSEMTPRTKLVSVPYAYRVGTVDGASGGTIIGKLNAGTGNTNTGTSAFVFGENSAAGGSYATASGGISNTASGYAATTCGGQ